MENELKRRDLGMFTLLMVVTLGLYSLYLVPHLGLSVNRMIKKDEYKFNQVLLVGIFTCGIALLVYEVLFAYSLENHTDDDRKATTRNLGGYVLVLNILTCALAFVSGGFGIIISFFLGCWATWLIQNQVNIHIDSLTRQTTHSDSSDVIG